MVIQFVEASFAALIALGAQGVVIDLRHKARELGVAIERPIARKVLRVSRIAGVAILVAGVAVLLKEGWSNTQSDDCALTTRFWMPGWSFIGWCVLAATKIGESLCLRHLLIASAQPKAHQG
jgi:hypothetical protein